MLLLTEGQECFVLQLFCKHLVAPPPLRAAQSTHVGLFERGFCGAELYQVAAPVDEILHPVEVGAEFGPRDRSPAFLFFFVANPEIFAAICANFGFNTVF